MDISLLLSAATALITLYVILRKLPHETASIQAQAKRDDATGQKTQLEAWDAMFDMLRKRDEEMTLMRKDLVDTQLDVQRMAGELDNERRLRVSAEFERDKLRIEVQELRDEVKRLNQRIATLAVG